MRQCVIQELVAVGFCSLCIAQAAFAIPRSAAPEIDAGSAAGALTIIVGALTLLGERWRRK